MEEVLRRVKLCGGNYYAILEVPQNATKVQIKAAYKRLARLLHPDKNKGSGADDAFKTLGKAKDVLMDDVQRWIFDTTQNPIVNDSLPKKFYCSGNCCRHGCRSSNFATSVNTKKVYSHFGVRFEMPTKMNIQNAHEMIFSARLESWPWLKLWHCIVVLFLCLLLGPLIRYLMSTETMWDDDMSTVW
ncbi:dnaJ homolog subfamily B member 1-like [Drosophila madeirensis]|uniref:DnaJ homolog subfamily B member 1-like n=1 Tax=Drosophila madeirensis TaxID=30013 RepID=A0AAU9G3X2_DROMD